MRCALEGGVKYLLSCGYDKAEAHEPERQMLDDFRRALQARQDCEHDWDAGGLGRHCLKCPATEPVKVTAQDNYTCANCGAHWKHHAQFTDQCPNPDGGFHDEGQFVSIASVSTQDKYYGYRCDPPTVHHFANESVCQCKATTSNDSREPK